MNLSETTRAPQTSAQCRFYKPAENKTDKDRFGYWQCKLRELFGRIPRPRPDGNGGLMGYDLAFERVMKNLVTTGGKNDLLDKYFAGAAYTASWSAGLVSSVSFSAYNVADTMASHAGWLEAGGANAPTFAGARKTITFGAAAGGVKASSAIPTWTFTGAGTVKGLFTTTGTAVDGATGILYSAGNFTAGDAPVGVGYVMTCTFSATQT